MSRSSASRTELRRMAVYGFGTLAILGTIMALPKDPAYAAGSRLFLTGIAFGSLTMGFAGFAAALVRWRAARLTDRHAARASAIRDTVSYLAAERNWARRGIIPAASASIAALGGHILAHWPQLSALAPYRSALGALAIGAAMAVPFIAYRHRGHFVNAVFLGRYVEDQLRHTGEDGLQGLPVRPPGPAVVVTGPGRFRIAGFKWRFSDLVTNLCVIGQTGSGKTVTCLNSLLEGLILSHREPDNRIAGLIIDAKGDFLPKIGGLLRRADRSDDLVVLDPGAWAEAGGTLRSIAWNPLDNDDEAGELAARLVAVLRMIGLETGGEGSYFLDSARAFLESAIVLLRAAQLTPVASLLDILRLSQEREDETPLYHSLVRAISERYPSEVPGSVLKAIGYFESQWGRMAPGEQSGVRGSIHQMLFEFLGDPFAEIFTRPSTIGIPAILDQGKILYVHMPASGRERMSRVVNTLIKLEFQRQVLLRPGKRRPSFLLADEFQVYLTTGSENSDATFFERSRESNHASIIATQNISSLLWKAASPYEVKSLLGNCSVKVLLRNTEEETLRWGSQLFGSRSEIFVTANEQADAGGWFRRRNTSYSRSARQVPRVPVEAFPDLRIPERGDPQAQFAEALVHMGARGTVERHRLVFPVNPLE